MKYLVLVFTLVSNLVLAADYPVLASYQFKCKFPGVGEIKFVLDKVRNEWNKIEFYRDGYGSVYHVSVGGDSSNYAAGLGIHRNNIFPVIYLSKKSKDVSPPFTHERYMDFFVEISAMDVSETAIARTSKGQEFYDPDYRNYLTEGKCSIRQTQSDQTSRPPYGLPPLK